MTPWPPAMLARLMELWGGGMSGGRCVRALNAEFGTQITRNAVIGMVTRHFVGERGNDPLPYPQPSRPPPSNPRPVPFPPAPPPQPWPGIIRLVDRPPLRCPFPLWAHETASGYPDFMVCGEPRAPLRPYCAKHMKLTHNPPPRPRDRRAEGFQGGTKYNAAIQSDNNVDIE